MITITREGERLIIELPHSKGDPCVSCGVHNVILVNTKGL